MTRLLHPLASVPSHVRSGLLAAIRCSLIEGQQRAEAVSKVENLAHLVPPVAKRCRVSVSTRSESTKSQRYRPILNGVQSFYTASAESASWADPSVGPESPNTGHWIFEGDVRFSRSYIRIPLVLGRITVASRCYTPKIVGPRRGKPTPRSGH